MPVIRITDSTWDRLKRWAVPLEDSPEDAVRKTLDAAEEHLKCPQSKGRISVPAATPPKKGRKLPKGLKTPNKAYHRPILEALHELGGSGSVSQVLDLVEQKMSSVLNDVDRQPLPSSGIARWHNTAQWGRFDLVNRGLLKSDSRTGVWELSSQGIRELDT